MIDEIRRFREEKNAEKLLRANEKLGEKQLALNEANERIAELETKNKELEKQLEAYRKREEKITDVEKTIGTAEAEAKKAKVDLERVLRQVIKIAEPVELSMLQAVYGGDYEVSETASAFELNQPDAKGTLLVPKFGLRLWSSFGAMPDLAKGKPYATLLEMYGWLLPKKLFSDVHFSFLRRSSKGGERYFLETPLKASHILISFISILKIQDAWKGCTFSQVIRKPITPADKEIFKGNEEVYETHLLVEFPVTEEGLPLSPEEEAMELPKSVIDDSQLRSALYSEYMAHFFKS